MVTVCPLWSPQTQTPRPRSTLHAPRTTHHVHGSTHQLWQLRVQHRSPDTTTAVVRDAPGIQVSRTTAAGAPCSVLCVQRPQASAAGAASAAGGSRHDVNSSTDLHERCSQQSPSLFSLSLCNTIYVRLFVFRLFLRPHGQVGAGRQVQCVHPGPYCRSVHPYPRTPYSVGPS